MQTPVPRLVDQFEQGTAVLTNPQHTREFLGVCFGKVLLHSTVVFWYLSGRLAMTILLRASLARGALPTCWLPRYRVGAGPASCVVLVLLLLQHIWADVSGSP